MEELNKEELNKEELSLIELEQSYKEEERSENLNKLLLIISLLSIFQVVEIFFSDKNNIFDISMILIMILLLFIQKKQQTINYLNFQVVLLNLAQY